MYVHEYPLALVYAGVPVTGKHSPYIVLVSGSARLRVEVELGSPEQGVPRLSLSPSGLGWRVELALKSFLDVVSDRLEEPLEASLRLSWSGLEAPPSSTVYAAATLALLEAVAAEGGYSMERGELLEAARSIDVDAGAWYDFLDAARAAMLEERSMVYRHGEDPLPLDAGGSVELRLVGEEDIGEDATRLMSDSLLSIAARFTGIAVVEHVSRLREEGFSLEAWKTLARVENGLYYTLYGAQLPPEGCKWTPGLQRVYGVCVGEEAPGDRVSFTL